LLFQNLRFKTIFPKKISLKMQTRSVGKRMDEEKKLPDLPPEIIDEILLYVGG
jgi:hypothetical protein